MKKTAYLLGAGFSVPAGLPTLANFFDHARRVLPPNLFNELERVRGDCAKRSNYVKDYSNLETLFGAIDIPGIASDSERDIRWLREAIVRCTATTSVNFRGPPVDYRCYFRSSADPPRRPGTELGTYAAFLSHLRAKNVGKNGLDRDAIITTNYDLVLEYAAEEYPDTAIDYTCGSLVATVETTRTKRQQVPVIKLHGSVSWWFDGEQVVRLEPDDVARRVTSGADYSKACIVPPTWRKDSTGLGHPAAAVLEEAKQSAISHLETADRLVVIGYSLPHTDGYLKGLLEHGLGGRGKLHELRVFDVVDGSEAERRYSGLRPYFERWEYSSRGLAGFLGS